MSQFDDVSNNANPTFDAEFAIRMTVNARFPKTPHRQARPVGASELMLDSLDKKTPSQAREPEGRHLFRGSAQMANKGGGFKAALSGEDVAKPPASRERKAKALLYREFLN